jgi:hypothetical protein
VWQLHGQLVCQIQLNVIINASIIHLVEQEDLGDGLYEWETKASANPWLRSTSDEKLDQWQLVDKLTQDREDG